MGNNYTYFYDDNYDYDNSNTVTLQKPQNLKVICPLGMLICLGGLVGNGLVLGLLGFSVKWGDFTVFVFHLSLADFLYLSGQTMWFMQIILHNFRDIRFHMSYVLLLTNISYWAGLCVLTAISVWRCLSVLCPIWCRLQAPRHAPAAACSLIWVLSVSVNVHLFLVCLVGKFFNRNSCDVYLLTWSVCFCVLFSVTVMCTLTTLFKVRCGTRRRPPRTFYITVLLTVLFLLFTFPLGIYVVLLLLSPEFDLPNILLLLSCVNSSANPLVYYFVGRIGGRRRGQNLREVFQKALGEESGLRRDSSSGAVNSSM